MSTNSRINNWLKRTLLLLLLSIFGGAVTNYAQAESAQFTWTNYPLKVGVLEFGATTQTEVLSKMFGPTHVYRGDGGDPTVLCYLQKSVGGQLLRLKLYFFGGGEDASLSGIEWRVLPDPEIGDSKKNCSEPEFVALPLGLTNGVQLGDSRADTRRMLGVPTKKTPARDEYSKSANIPNGFLVTKLELIFKSNGRLKILRIRQIKSS